MLGVADYWKKIKKEPRANVAQRLALYRDAAFNKKLQASMRELCRRDILFYINTFVWQFNPLKKGDDAVGPFITWEFQDKAIVGRPETTGNRGILWCYEHNRSAVVEKSREMGATWLFLIVQDWLCLFHKHVQTLNISKSADAVDCKSPNSLFWKLRFMHRHLPEWLRGHIKEEKMFMGYDKTHASITGEASTGRAGVGGRAGVIFVDELSKIKEASEIRQRTANTADCRFFNSTHEGPDTEFFKLTQTPEFVKIVFHWSQHPEKKRGLYKYNEVQGKIEVLDPAYHYPPDFQFHYSPEPLGGPFPGLRSPWYDAKCVEIGSPRGVAVELDIDPTGSVSQFFDPLKLRSLKEAYCQEPSWRGDVSFDRATGKGASLISSPSGPLLLWTTRKSDTELPEGPYGVGVDVSTGRGRTNSCLSVFHARTGEKVAEYATPFLEPGAFAEVAVALCRLLQGDYDAPLLVWEAVGPGGAFGQKVYELGYRRIYTRPSSTAFGAKQSDIPGWVPSLAEKRLLLEEYRAALDQRRAVNRSVIALEECLDYRYTDAGNVEHPEDSGGDDPTGAKVNHGDRVIADALAWKMVKYLNVLRKADDEPEEEIHPGSLAGRRLMAENERQRREEWV